MSHHACYALQADYLDIVVIDDSKPMQGILRSMLAGLRPHRIRMFDDIRDALESMLREPPNLVITDWRVGSYSGNQLLKMMRSRNMDPLCFVPVIVITGHATQSVVDKVMKGGAHVLLVKPVAPSTLIDRIQWVIEDPRRFVLGDNQRYMIEGVAEKLKQQQGRVEVLKKARAFHEEARRREGPKPVAKKAAPEPVVAKTTRRGSAPVPTPRPAPRTSNPFAAVVRH